MVHVVRSLAVSAALNNSGRTDILGSPHGFPPDFFREVFF